MIISKSFKAFAATLILSLSFLTANAQTEVEVSANPLAGIPSGKYEVDVTHASVVWKVSHLGFSTYVGRFNEFTADLMLDSDEFSKSRVDVDIKVDSIDTHYPFADEKDFNKILAEDWFDSDEHPSIIFKANSVSALVDSKATVSGDMTMLGETHPVELDVTFNKAVSSHPFKKVAAIGFSARAAIDRTVWGLTKNAPGIGAEVVIEIEGEFLQSK